MRPMPELPDGFNKARFLRMLTGRVARLVEGPLQLSVPAELYLRLLHEACLNQSQDLDMQAKLWIRKLIMTTLVDASAEALKPFQDRLRLDPSWWSMVSRAWEAACAECANALAEELPAYLKVSPVYSVEQFEALRIAILLLTPVNVLGEAFVDALNEPLLSATFDEDAEVSRLAEVLVNLITENWPLAEDDADPWASPPDSVRTRDAVAFEEMLGKPPRDASATVAAPAMSATPPASRAPSPVVSRLSGERRSARRACARQSILPRHKRLSGYPRVRPCRGRLVRSKK